MNICSYDHADYANKIIYFSDCSISQNDVTYNKSDEEANYIINGFSTYEIIPFNLSLDGIDVDHVDRDGGDDDEQIVQDCGNQKRQCHKSENQHHIPCIAILVVVLLVGMRSKTYLKSSLKHFLCWQIMFDEFIHALVDLLHGRFVGKLYHRHITFIANDTVRHVHHSVHTNA